MKKSYMWKKADILKKCFDKYGDKYTLTIEDDNIDSESKVLCTCSIHNTSKYVNIRHFLGGDSSGCKECASEKQRKIKKQNYIEKFIEMWGDGYTFDKLKYISWRDSGIITCKEHGDFEIKELRYAFDHIPCPKCYERYLRDQRNNGYLTRLKELYGDRYIWLTTDFGDYYTDYVKFICPIHGEVKQTLSTLLNIVDCDNFACPKCKKERSNDNLSYTLEEALDKAKTLEWCKDYDFSSIKEWKGVKEYYTFRCKKHNEYFEQTFDQIFNAKYNGCQSCKKERREENFVPFYTPLSFAERAKEVHGDFYGYDKVEYVKFNQKVCITCPIHGDFWQTPNNHLSGGGCPKCKKSVLETKVRVLLEENNIEYIHEKSVRDLTNEMIGDKPQRVDFYLPKHNLCIECQGEQHFTPVPFGNMSEDKAKKQFEKNVIFDEFKYNALIKHEYDIIYFFKFRNLNSDRGRWYEDKKCFYDEESLLEYIKNKDYDAIKRNWYNQEKYILYKNNRKTKTVWNKESCYQEAKKYDTKTKFARCSQTAYKYARLNDWLKEYTWFIEIYHKWTYDECYEKALKYKNKYDFKKEYKSAYNVSVRNKWMKDFHWLKRKGTNCKWTYEKCYNEALKYKNRKDFMKGCSGACVAAENHKWMKDYHWFIPLVNKWTHDKVYEEAKKYSRMQDFRKKSKGAFEYAERHNLLIQYDWLNKK